MISATIQKAAETISHLDALRKKMAVAAYTKKKRAAQHNRARIKERRAAELLIERALQPFFVDQIESAAKVLAATVVPERKVLEQYLAEKFDSKSEKSSPTDTKSTQQALPHIFNPKDWNQKLVDTLYPAMVKIAVVGMDGEMRRMGLHIKRGFAATKVFCPTGAGGGVDATCKPGGGGAAGFKNISTGKVTIDKIFLIDEDGEEVELPREAAKKEIRSKWFALTGRKSTLQDIAKAVGIPDGCNVSFSAREDTGDIEVSGHSKEILSIRRTVGEEYGGQVIHNDELEVRPEYQGAGIGTKILASQVENAASSGFDEIVTSASRATRTNGYYTWPRLGYDGPIEEDIQEALPTSLKGAENISALMKSKEGREWWKTNGVGLRVSFSLEQGSQSRKVLDAYVTAKFGSRTEGGKSSGDDGRGRSPLGRDLGQPQPGETKSTATDLLSGLDDSGGLLDMEILDTPYGPINMAFLFEYPDWMKHAIAEFLHESFAEPYWEELNKTTHGDIEKYLQEGIRDGWSIERMASEMAPQLLETGRYATIRGRNIARTEAGHALNGARSMGIDSVIAELQGTGLDIQKLWNSVLGTTTRDSHRAIHGVPADQDGMWLLAGVRCRWPGDTVLPPSERCNCQCTIESAFGMSDSEARDLIQIHEGKMASASWAKLRVKVWEKCGGEGGTPGPCPLNKPEEKPIRKPRKPKVEKPAEEKPDVVKIEEYLEAALKEASSKSTKIKVGTHVKKLTGDKAEAESYLKTFDELDTTFRGGVSKFLEKHPIDTLHVGKTANLGSSSGLYSPGTGKLTMLPAAKRRPCFLDDKGASVAGDHGATIDEGDSPNSKKQAQNVTLVHELGHHIAMTAIKSVPNGNVEVYKKLIINNFMDDDKKASTYAATQPHEYFAESFAQYHVDKKKLSPQAVKMVEGVMEVVGGSK